MLILGREIVAEDIAGYGEIAGTDFPKLFIFCFTSKFTGKTKLIDKVKEIFNGLPKPKELITFTINDLPLLTSIDYEVQAVTVHRSNNQNRDATPGQKAMATAMAFPEAAKGGDRKSSFFKKLENEDTPSKPQISKARYVLRNSPMVEGERYPKRWLDMVDNEGVKLLQRLCLAIFRDSATRADKNAQGPPRRKS